MFFKVSKNWFFLLFHGDQKKISDTDKATNQFLTAHRAFPLLSGTTLLPLAKAKKY